MEQVRLTPFQCFAFERDKMKNLFAAALFVFLPVAAMADTQLERLENVAEQMSEAMFGAMVRMVEKEGGDPAPLLEAVPDSDWDADYREAGSCLLEKYVEASSTSAVDKMLDEMEAFIPKMAGIDLESLEADQDFLPEGVSEEYSMQVNSDCGMNELMMDRMENSGFMAAVMQAMAGQ